MENYLMQHMIKMNLLDLCFRDVEANAPTTKVEKERERDVFNVHHIRVMFITTSE